MSLEYAEILTYTTDDGQQWFVDRIEAVPAQYIHEAGGNDTSQPASATQHPSVGNFSNDSSTDSAEKIDETPEAPAGPIQTKEVEIFVTQWSAPCQKLEQLLKDRNIKYTKYDVQKSNEGREKYKEIIATGVPVIKIDTDVIRGYNPAAILPLLPRNEPIAVKK